MEKKVGNSRKLGVVMEFTYDPFFFSPLREAVVKDMDGYVDSKKTVFSRQKRKDAKDFYFIEQSQLYLPAVDGELTIFEKISPFVSLIFQKAEMYSGISIYCSYDSDANSDQILDITSTLFESVQERTLEKRKEFHETVRDSVENFAKRHAFQHWFFNRFNSLRKGYESELKWCKENVSKTF